MCVGNNNDDGNDDEEDGEEVMEGVRKCEQVTRQRVRNAFPNHVTAQLSTLIATRKSVAVNIDDSDDDEMYYERRNTWQPRSPSRMSMSSSGGEESLLNVVLRM